MTQKETPENVTDPNSGVNGNPAPQAGKGVPEDAPDLNPDWEDDISQPTDEAVAEGVRKSSQSRKGKK